MELTNHIKQELQALGIAESRFEEIARDLGKAMLKRVTALYLTKLSEEERQKLAKLSPEGVNTFMKEKGDMMRLLPSKEIQQVCDEVWVEYRESLRK